MVVFRHDQSFVWSIEVGGRLFGGRLRNTLQVAMPARRIVLYVVSVQSRLLITKTISLMPPDLQSTALEAVPDLALAAAQQTVAINFGGG